MPTVNLYIDLLRTLAIRGPTSAAPAPVPDFRNPTVYTINCFFMGRVDVATENYNYVRYSGGTPQLKLRRNKAPDYCTFTLSFVGYTSPTIDARLSTAAIATLIGQMPSVGPGNVKVTGNANDGFTVEFINGQAGVVQPMFTGTVKSPTNGECVIRQSQVGGQGINAVQIVKLREAPLSIASGWAELTASSQWGWVGTLDTTAIPPNMWADGNMILDVGLEAGNVRTGTDGVIANEGTTRSGSDGQNVSGPSDVGITIEPVQDSSGDCYLVAKNGNTIYNRLFKQSDVGRTVQDNGAYSWIRDGTVIVRVVEFEFYNAALLSAPFEDGKIGRTSTSQVVVNTIVDLLGPPTNIFKSATASFTASDVGHPISGTGIASDTFIKSIIDSQTVLLSQTMTVAGSALSWTISVLPSNVFTSASATWTVNDIGARLECAALPLGTTIVALQAPNSVVLSQRALVIGSSLSWTLKPAQGGFPAPAVTHVVIGTLAVPSTQQVVFSRQPTGGYVTIRDGGSGMPLANVSVPLSASGIQAALNGTYPNYNGVTVTEIIPGSSYQIAFGVLGKQKTLVVDISPATYPNLLAQIPVGEPMNVEQPTEPQSPVTVPNKRNLNNMWLIGVPGDGSVYKLNLGRDKIVTLNDGTNSQQMTRRYLTTADNFWLHPASIGEAAGNFRLERYENIDERGAMVAYDWVGYKIPADRMERMQQNRSVYWMPISVLNNRLVDMQIASVSMSTSVRINYKYWIWTASDTNGLALPPDGPYGTIVHFVSIGGFTGVQHFEGGGGFGGPTYPPWAAGTGTSVGRFTESWQRRKWHADIWEQQTNVSGV